MADREKVIRELKAARLFFEMGSNRADGVVGNLGCKSGMKYIDDAFALLKEQEAVKIKVNQLNESGRCGLCPNCRNELNETDYPNYCGFCGRAVKWG